MQIDFFGIQAFLAIVENGSFQLAATQLNLSQTAVSHRIRKLEEGLGVRLIARTTRDVTLTDAGRALLPNARSAVRELSVSCESVKKHGQHANQWLAFACLPTVAIGILAPLLQDFRARWPEAPVRVFDSPIREIAELVESNMAAFGISVLQSGHTQLAVERIVEEPFVLVCPSGHPMAGERRVEWQAVEAEPLIRISLPSGNSMTIDDALGAVRERLRWRYEAQHNAMALEMVRAGLGLTVVPRLSVAEGNGLRVLAIASPAVARTLCLVTRRNEALGAEAEWLRQRAVGLLHARLSHEPDE